MREEECKGDMTDEIMSADTGLALSEANNVDAKFLGGHTSKSGVPSEGHDRRRIDEIIVEASRGSKYYAHQRQREQCLLTKIDVLRKKKFVLEQDVGLLRRTHRDVVAWMERAKAGRDLSRLFLHIDMDAFFAAVECLRNPKLGERPMAVGGDSMLCTANYEARKFGVTSAMPGYIARRLCPQLVVIPPDFEAYREASHKVQAILREYDTNLTSYSLDEASLDVTEYFRERSKEDTTMTVPGLLEEIRRQVREKTLLTCSIGAAPNRQLAKLCSNINKPNGQFYLEPEADSIMAFVSKQPAKRISGVGKVMTRLLSDLLGISTCRDILDQAVWIRLLLSPTQSAFLLRSALGLGQAFGESSSSSPSSSNGDARKSISTERTFKAITCLEDMQQVLRDLCEQLAIDIEHQRQRHNHEHSLLLGGRTIGIKMKTTAFEVHTRAVTVERPISDASDIYQQATILLAKNKPVDLRLLGVRLSGLVYEDESGDNAEMGTSDREDVKYRPLDRFIIPPKGTPPKRPECPICATPIDVHPDDILRINEHIDRCLGSNPHPSAAPSSIKRVKKDTTPGISLDVFFVNKKA